MIKIIKSTITTKKSWRDKHEDVKYKIKYIYFFQYINWRGDLKCRHFRLFEFKWLSVQTSRYSYMSMYININVTTSQKPTIETNKKINK